MKHNANFKYDLEWGKQGETVVGEIQQGEKTEVKSERDKWIKTGNHYCEYQSRGKESGIKKTQAEWWTINFYSGDRFCFNITLKTKYVTRYKMKNGLEDLKKAEWYLQRLIKKYENNYGGKE